MFRRNNSRIEHRGALRRRKSTGSVAINHHNRGFANLELHPAHRDAHIAARVSFTKAREESDRSSSTGIPGSLSTYGLARSDSFMKGPDIISYNGDKSEATTSKAYSSLCRQRSVRFTGPTARKKRDVAIRANGSWAEHSDISGRMHSSAFGGRLPKSSPLAGHAYDDFWLDRSLDLESKNGETVCESEQSFYPVRRQKLRKSRSMFNGSFMSSECHSETAATASSGWNGHDPSKHAVIGTGKSSLRSPKSMSFLRLNSSRGPSIRQNESGISTSPSKMSLRGSLRLKNRPSVFLRSKDKRNMSLSDMKTSMRNSSNNSMPITSTIPSEASSLSKGSGLRKAARKVSKSVRSKLKDIFGRSKKLEDSENTNNTEPSSVDHSRLSLQGETSVSRVKSYVPSLRSVASEHCLQACQGSLEMLEDGPQQTDGEKSRVTSWTNSSTHTVVSTTLDAEWEPQRLSVIDEGGHAVSTLERWRSSEDEERAYSALVQRLDDMQKQQNREASLRGGRLNDNFGGGIGQSTAGIDATISVITSNGVTQGEPEHNYNEGAIPNEYDLETGPFFSATNSEGTSPTGHLFRAQSPYRRALRKSMRIQERSSSIKPVNLRYLSSLSALSLPTRRSSPEGSERDIRLSSAESVYSDVSATLGKLGNSESPFDMGEFDTVMLSSPHNQEREAIIKDTSERSHQREVSTASSVEWKTWLSAKVSKLEDCGEVPKVLGEEQTWNPWSAMGHVRENAEIGPNSNTSDTSDAENGSIDGSRSEELDITAPPATQSIVIEDDVVYHSHRMLTHDENAPPECKTKKVEDFEQHSKAIRSVSSLPNVNLSEGYETRCRKSITPQKPKGSPSALADSLSRPKKAYMNSGAASSLKSSPGLSAAVRRQFGTVATGSPGRRSIRGGEDVSQSRVVREATSFDDCRFGRGLDAQAMGSKRMVELFLNSRKTRRTPDADADWPGAFV
ncbi:uncharacterized protein BBA_04359 [Beauveria bassiana ARSEF 2860]|uniref:Uncharacterized protein n=1 Tax=Beauveria bassiana (strain ARSEF 2860) TaxID=655819 RepID=J4KNW6_BEAB2|nr:uncharacterized protein BBA_04359 [Beauveria bassiana ARSEF 2860]EJP66419.1 hypothetical protein BBA_04359 [Beauveria bassiana ARSEF 2860]